MGAYTGVPRLQGLPGGRGSRSLAGSAGLGWTHHLVQTQASPRPLQAMPWLWACLQICQSGAPGRPCTPPVGACLLGASSGVGVHPPWLGPRHSMHGCRHSQRHLNSFLMLFIEKASPGETSPPDLALFLPTVWSHPPPNASPHLHPTLAPRPPAPLTRHIVALLLGTCCPPLGCPRCLSITNASSHFKATPGWNLLALLQVPTDNTTVLPSPLCSYPGSLGADPKNACPSAPRKANI